jgi:hypothetical protein
MRAPSQEEKPAAVCGERLTSRPFCGVSSNRTHLQTDGVYESPEPHSFGDFEVNPARQIRERAFHRLQAGQYRPFSSINTLRT